jgi:putative transposase
MRKTFQYKAELSPSTEKGLNDWLSLCRDLYNACIEQRKDAWERCGKRVDWVKQANELVVLKADFPQYKKVGSQVLQDVVRRADKSFKNFFRRVRQGQKPGYPRYKGRDRYDSFTFPSTRGWSQSGRNFVINKVGRLKLYLSRPIEGNIKTVTVKRSFSGKWFVNFSCDDVPENILTPSSTEIGINLGLRVFLTDSDGNTIENRRFFKEAQPELRRKQRSLSRKKRESNNRKKAKLEVAKCHEKITNKRKDFIKKTVRRYVQDYGTIYVEDLHIVDMLKHRYLSKGIADASWGYFLDRLKVAAEEAKRKVIRVDPRNTSQVCLCGKIVKKTLAVTVHKCPHCGLVMDKGVLAAKNILRAGQSLQALTRSLGLVA